MEIYFNQEDQITEELQETMEKAATLCVQKEGIDEECCAVSVSFVDAERIHELNREYRGVDRVTDVLSFPQFESPEDIEDEIEQIGEAEIGDVVINRQRAMEQAIAFGHSYERELIYLFVHSILHLLGYDHMEDDEKAVMRSREEEIMDELGIPRRTDEAAPAAADPGHQAGRPGLGSAAQRTLFEAAATACGNAYAPYSHFRVGAAILTGDGSVYTGINIENASYPAGICAERVAAAKAIAEGKRDFQAIAVASPDGEPSMCGICRQFLSEFSTDMLVIYGSDITTRKTATLGDLLPSGFALPK